MTQKGVNLGLCSSELKPVPGDPLQGTGTPLLLLESRCIGVHQPALSPGNSRYGSALAAVPAAFLLTSINQGVPLAYARGGTGLQCYPSWLLSCTAWGRSFPRPRMVGSLIAGGCSSSLTGTSHLWEHSFSWCGNLDVCCFLAMVTFGFPCHLTRGLGLGLNTEEATLWPQTQAGDRRCASLHGAIKTKQLFTVAPVSQLTHTLPFWVVVFSSHHSLQGDNTEDYPTFLGAETPKHVVCA